MADPSCVLPLPTSLVLLLHLHILSYPQCNAPEYSLVTLFAPSRPLRDRTKTMEDIVSFLIGKIEGKAKLKSILAGTYPCLQPSDTVAFRVNVAKYMETLRATVTRQGLQVSTSIGRIPRKVLQAESASSKTQSSISSQLGSKGSSASSSLHETSLPVAWWWSAIVVRKSLLEDCSGDRFEKLLLALSTHALFVKIPSSSSLHPQNTTAPELTIGLRNQSREYATLLSRALELHTARALSVSRLNNHTRELISLRVRLALTPHEDAEIVEMQRLLAIRDSKQQDLVDAWETIHHTGMLGTNEDGNKSMTASDALKWLFSIAGISTGDTQREEPLCSAGTFTPDPAHSFEELDLAAIQTLPTASAHHPANIHKLRSLQSFVSLHSDLSVDNLAQTSVTGSALTPPALQELSLGASVQTVALKAALESAVKVGREISRKLDATLKTATAAQEWHVDMDSKQLDLWTSVAKSAGLNAKVSPTQDPSIMRFLSDISIGASITDDTHTKQRIEASVSAFREALQPRISSPSILDIGLSYSLESTPLAITKEQSSKIPLSAAAFTPSSSQHATTGTESSYLIPMTPKTPRPYETSTPPPRSHSGTVRAKRIAESGRSKTNDALLTPTDSREFSTVRSNTVKTSPPQEILADMSLPAFSDGDMTDLGMIPSQEFEASDEEWYEEHMAEVEQVEVPYEGHSVTLRDILLRVGDGEDLFHLIDDLEDLDEGLGNETMGWG